MVSVNKRKRTKRGASRISRPHVPNSRDLKDSRRARTVVVRRQNGRLLQTTSSTTAPAEPDSVHSDQGPAAGDYAMDDPDPRTSEFYEDPFSNESAPAAVEEDTTQSHKVRIYVSRYVLLANFRT
jgi:hypothetical protein